ncbi:hypothetical protein DEM26_18535 [Thioclava sp. NG1]|uniref:hypothetical protein n=1 Tax=unclassified Thioclava TaxID=2621713 RepID=UPI000B546460|nr:MULTISPECIES: hypothetical protein [unclassified Thioclava]OWY10313.1 hypothetical protein B6V72_17725 [Thioclava sp. F34-6]PWE48343.1 hypothetical protein DEM26_18535 [Thioclava sp. NG1]
MVLIYQHAHQARSQRISEDGTIQTFEMEHRGGYTTYSVETLNRHASLVSLKITGFYGWTAKLSVGSGTHEWLAATSRLHFSTPEKRRWLSMITDFVSQVLAALEGAALALRQTEFPARALEDLAPEEQAEIRADLPKAFSASPEVRSMFGECLLELARLFPNAREILREGRAEAARDRRLKKQYDKLPEGMILACRRSGAAVGIVSHNHPLTGKSVITWRTRNDECTFVLSPWQRREHCLMTAERARALAPGVLSGHETLQAIQQAEQVAAFVPDLA